MEGLKENILEAILNKSDVRVKEDFYISYDNVERIINEYFEDFPKIIIEKNLQEDFIEGLENLLNRELEVKEIENLANSGAIDECIDDMFQAESDSISRYYKQYFVSKNNSSQEAQEEYQCSKCNRFFTEEDIFRFDSPCICNVCAQD